MQTNHLNYILVSSNNGSEVFRESVPVSSTTVEDVFILAARKAKFLGASTLQAENTPRGLVIRDISGLTEVEVSVIGLFLYNGDKTEPVNLNEA
jgi:hypothetical protein